MRRFHNIHAGARCFIIGNGPSIRSQDLTHLRDEWTFAVNFFVLHEQFDAINPKYLCISNPKFWRDGSLPPNLLAALREHPDLPVFAEHTFWRLNRRKRLLDRRRCFGVYVDYERPAYAGHVSLDPARGTAHGHTVIIDLCLPLAFYMGFREIHLLGCDCDYRLDSAPDHAGAYFYDVKQQQVAPDSNEYLADRWVRNAFASYETLRLAFEKEGRTICNATRGGKLEVFPRRNYEDLVCRT